MQNQSLREYQLIRDEMKSLKDCITHYVGYVLGGSGAAVYGFTNLAANGFENLGLAIGALMMSLLISMVLLIVFYKFHSHNRFAGYCKLLSQETFNNYTGRSASSDLYAWEICLERLRSSENNSNIMRERAGVINIIEPTRGNLSWIIDEYNKDPVVLRSTPGPATNKRRCRLGLESILQALLGGSKTGSWEFPPYIAVVFLLICIGFLFLGGYSTICTLTGESPIKHYGGEALIAVAVFVILAQLLLWSFFYRRIRSLMFGNATVEAFFWRFLTFRADYLNTLGIIPQYVDANRRIDQLRSN